MMFKKMVTTILCLSLFLVACNPVTSIEVDEIRVSVFEAFGDTNGDFIKVIKDEKEIKTIVKLINQARKETGAVDMPEGNYTVELVSGDGEIDAYHLWIEDSDSNGTIMSLDDTSTIYTLSKSRKEKLRTALIK